MGKAARRKSTLPVHQLDVLDRKILYYLDTNARQSVSELSRTLRQNRDTVGYRVERLQARGIIQKYTTTINHALLDLTIYKAYVRVDTSPGKIEGLSEYLAAHPRVYWLARCDGNWDLMVAVIARSVEEFYSLYMQILSRFNDIILSSKVFTLVELVMLRKDYLYGQSKDRSSISRFSIGSSSEKVLLDEIDYGILKLLDDDARMPTSSIAERLETSPTVVSYRIEKLEQSRVILGYRLEVDRTALGMLFMKTELYLRNYRKKLLDEFFVYCNESPHITTYIQQLGEWTLEIETETYGYEQYNNIMDELRTHFSKLIRNFQTVLIREQQYKWIPRDLIVD